MNLSQARNAIAAILESIPERSLPKPTKVEKDRDGNDVHWFGSVGYTAGTSRMRDFGETEFTAIRGDYRRDAISDLFDRERMQRIENAHWAALTTHPTPARALTTEAGL